jgi:DNA repair protein RadC
MNKDKNRNSGDHSGHRRRKRQALLSSGADSMSDLDILEMLLYYAVQRADTRPIAQGLLEKFGSLEAVLSGDIKEIVKFSGLKTNAEVLFTLFKELNKRSNKPDNLPDLLEADNMKRFLINLYKDAAVESVYALYFDDGGTLVGKQIVFRGDVGSVRFSLRTITEGVIKCGGTSVVLAHNHPSGILVPSNDDIITTNNIAAHLRANDIDFIEHYIVGKDDCVGIINMK